VGERRRAGQHAREKVRSYALRGLAGLTFVVIATVTAGAFLGYASLGFAAVEAAAIAVALMADKLLSPALERWDRGATGEEAVGAVLAAFDAPGWHVMHDVVIGSRGNVDHVVIGPPGVFTIETKSHRGRIRARSVKRAMLAQAYAPAKALERVTRAKVAPLLVFSDAYVLPPVSRQRGVTVLTARRLVHYLERLPRSLSDEQAAALDAHLGEALTAAR
jgi:Nuclease-related domain